ncbi:hypothetical protein LJR234_006644 [Mesorhizobium amorphae]|uniref:hypothetical protein n=1 Tax=Mesorhizobium amorphae TaxID=71433 RepID=UPI003ED11ACA
MRRGSGAPSRQLASLILPMAQVRLFSLRLIAQGVVALPVHDCVLVVESAKAAAMAAMREESRRLVGVALPVEEKAGQ